MGLAAGSPAPVAAAPTSASVVVVATMVTAPEGSVAAAATGKASASPVAFQGAGCAVRARAVVAALLGAGLGALILL